MEWVEGRKKRDVKKEDSEKVLRGGGRDREMTEK
jgi:hypothetical protein